MAADSQIFTPIGNMNQDDSLIVPQPNSAGDNPFENGDYRYALNLRLGSSRNDNFGDGENIRDTVEVTGYRVKSQLMTNPSFSGSLAGWSQVDNGGLTWSHSAGGAYIGYSSAFKSKILYQTVAALANGIGIYIDVTCNSIAFTVTVVFLQGTTVLKEVSVLSGGVVANFKKLFSQEKPTNADGVGVYVNVDNGAGFPDFKINSLDVYGYTNGARPSGDEIVIGRLEDAESLNVYYAVYNSSDNHCLRYYSYADDCVYELLQWSGLSFESDSFVKLAKLDEWIAFTDRINPPRLINSKEITDLYMALGDAEFREYHISFHKWAPVMPPILRGYYDGSNDNRSRFDNKVIQISYRYKYRGNLFSTYSPYSAVANQVSFASNEEMTGIEIVIPGFILNEPGANTQYNYFNHTNVKFTAAVESIEIVYRESQIDVWRTLKKIDASKTTGNQVIKFDGKSDSRPIAQDAISQLFDTVPFLAGTVEAIDNRFVFADCLDELEPAQTPVITNVGVAKWTANTVGTYWNFGTLTTSADSVFTSLSSALARELAKRNVISDTTFKSRGIYKGAIQYMHKSGWISAGYTSDDFTWEIDEDLNVAQGENALMFKLGGFKPPSWAVAYQIMLTNCLNIDYFMFGAVNKFDILIDSTAITNAITETPEIVQNKIFEHFQNARLITGTDFNNQLENLKTNSIFRSINSALRKTQLAASITTASRLYININNWYNASTVNAAATQNNPMNNLYYNYRQGDRIRFTGSDVTTPTDAQKKIYDVLILEFTGNGIVIEKPSDLVWIPGLPQTGSPITRYGLDMTIEVYTPKVPSDKDYIFYERGEWYPVLYPGTENRDFSKKDWTYTNNAAVTSATYGDFTVFNKFPLNKGDCHFFIKRQYNNYDTISSSRVIDVRTCSMNQDDQKTYDYWDKCQGRPNTVYDSLPVSNFKTTQARFGGKIVEESFINRLNRFQDQDQEIYPSEYGRIRDLINTSNAQVESVGSILLALGEKEAWSIYVNRTTLEDLSGRTQVALSDKVLGSYNTLLGGHGTMNPESVSKFRGNVYYWNALDGSWIRYGRDGLTEISEYKMRNWFKELGDLVISEYATDEKPKVISEFDVFNNELVTFINHSNLPETFRGYDTYKGSIFSEDGRGWKFVHSYEPEMFAKICNVLLSFKEGSIYKHEAGEDHSTFYGTKYDVEIEPVFSKNGFDVKNWQALATVSTHKWSAERILSEFRGSKSKQQTSIPLSGFDEREDSYYAAIPMDQNSTGGKINGMKMKSKAIQVLLKLDPSVVSLSLIHYVSALQTDSPKNP
jgi:hypothetical protein